MNEAELVLWVVGAWLIIGTIIGVPFLLVGLTRVDPDADGSWVFRPLMLPGVAALWPIVLMWWIQGRTWADGPVEKEAP